MRYLIVTLVLLASIGVANGAIPDMTCRGTTTIHTFVVANPPRMSTYKSTDVFRFDNGSLYHRWADREEYRYNSVIQLPTTIQNQLLSGHMRFVFVDGENGYVVIADNVQWKIIYFKCSR